MPRRSFTFGRAFVLLILGATLGAVLFFARHLSPATLEAQVQEVLSQIIATEFELDSVELDVQRGVKIHNLRIYYPDGKEAIHCEKVVMWMDKDELLRGEVNVRQIDLLGLRATLRHQPAESGPEPGLPGIFRKNSQEGEWKTPLPVVKVGSGSQDSYLILEDVPWLPKKETLRFRVESVEGRLDHEVYVLYADLSEPRLGRIHVRANYDPSLPSTPMGPTGGLLSCRVTLGGVDLAAATRMIQTVPTGTTLEKGTLEGTLKFELHTREGAPLEPRVTRANLTVTGVAASLNLSGRKQEGRPPRLENGRILLRYEDEAIRIYEGTFDYVTPGGRRSPLTADGRISLREKGVSVRIRGKDVHLPRDDLRWFLDPHKLSLIGGRYEPTLLFDLDARIEARPDTPPTTKATLFVKDGDVRFAGPLNPKTGKREGFPYPVSGLSGKLILEYNVPGRLGRSRVIRLDFHARHPLKTPKPGGPAFASFVAKGHITGFLDYEGEPEDAEIEIRVKDVQVDEDVRAAFAASVRGVPYREFDVDGEVAGVIRVWRTIGKDPVVYLSQDVRFEGRRVAYKPFPLELTNARCRVRVMPVPPPEGSSALPHDMILIDDIHAEVTDGGTIRGSARIDRPWTPEERLSVDVRADDLALGANLRQAIAVLAASKLPERAAIGKPVQRIWKQIRPSGQVNARAKLGGEGPPDIQLDLGGRVRLEGYGGVRCPVERLAGVLAYDGTGVSLRNIQGQLAGAELDLEGRIPGDGSVDIRARLRGLPLAGPVCDLLHEIAPETRASFSSDLFEPDSRVDVRIEAKGGGDEAMRIGAELVDPDVGLRIGGRRIRIRGGRFTVSNEALVFKEVKVRSGEAWVRLRQGQFGFGQKGTLRLLLDAGDVAPEEHLLGLLGKEASRVLGPNLRLDLRNFEMIYEPAEGKISLAGALDLRRHRILKEVGNALAPTGAFDLAPITIRLPRDGQPLRVSGLVQFRGLGGNLPIALEEASGVLLIGEARVSEGFRLKGAIRDLRCRYQGREITDGALNIDVGEHYINLTGIEAKFYEGTLSGAVQVHTSDPGAFEIDVRLDDVELGELLRGDLPRKDQVSGKLRAAIMVGSPTGNLRHLTGRAQFEVRDGALIDLPTLRPIFAVLRQVTPFQVRPRFKNAELDLEFHGERIEVRLLHLSTALNDVVLYGRASLYGDLDLVVQPQVIRILDLPRLLDIPVLTSLLHLWHKTVYEIRLRGSIQSPRVKLRPLPFLSKARPQKHPLPEPSHTLRPSRIRPRVFD